MALTTLQMEPIFLHFQGNIKHFYIDNYIYSNNNEQETYCCFSMLKMLTRKRRNATLFVYCVCLELNKTVHKETSLFPSVENQQILK